MTDRHTRPRPRHHSLQQLRLGEEFAETRREQTEQMLSEVLAPAGDIKSPTQMENNQFILTEETLEDG